MKAPPTRLRILQSVEVDESSPGYIAAKQKQQERFKGTLESIFAKYGTMHESQSDEIDMMGDGDILVNRGHLRRAARHGALTDASFLNSVVACDVPDIGEDSEGGEGKEDSEDELAPTQPTKPSSAQKQKASKSTLQPQRVLSSPAVSTRIPFQAQTPQHTSLQIAQPVPYTPDPAATLLQHVQFPQTPAGQQAQSSFYAALTQTINQAVQQAVAPLFSSILPSIPNAQSPFTTVLPPQTTRATTVDTLTAARDPKWFFPPLPEQAREDLAARCQSRSKPVASSPSLDVAEQQEQPMQEDVAQESPCVAETPEQSTISVATLLRSQEPADKELRRSTRRTSPRVEIQHSGRRTRRRYVLTAEEEIYISKRKALHGRSWEEIRNTKEKWADWPLWVFKNRYTKRLKGQQLHLKDTPELEDTESVQGAREAECDALPSHHLPTPSSLEQEDSLAHMDDAATSIKEHIFSSSTHFDDDELDLLSLAGDDLASEQLQCESAADDAFCPDADETILPSVELTDFTDEHILQQGLLEGSPLEETNRSSPVMIKEEPILSSPLNKRKRRRLNVPQQVVPDSESDTDNNDVSDYHESNAHTTHSNPRPDSPALDLIGEDELQATITPTKPTIKRELSTPPPTSFLLRTPIAQSHSQQDIPSSGVKSASGLSRKAYLKKIKQSWTKTSTPAGKTVAKRRSFHTEPRKRTWAAVGDSDDELGF